MNDVTERIRAEISVHGVIPFARFMDLALYCPDCGYYEKENDNVGRHGDFYTSARVGSLFGELLAFQFAMWLAELPAGPLELVEAGAHEGQLGADILRWLQRYRPAIFARLHYVIDEPSDKRRAWQQATLKEFAPQVRWLEQRLSAHPKKFNGVIFSNELLDAMPVHRLGWSQRRREWFEWGVVVEGDRFSWARMENSPLLGPESATQQRLTGWPPELLDVLPEEFTVELSPAAENWWHDAGSALQRGRLLTFDYGLSEDEFIAPHRANGTLRSYRDHRLGADPLANAGAQDLTAHVNFGAIQQVGERAGLKTELFTTQPVLLTGIMKKFWEEAEGQGNWTGARACEFQTLVHPDHLGHAFRVLVQTR